jgi:hypothetical protein
MLIRVADKVYISRDSNDTVLYVTEAGGNAVVSFANADVLDLTVTGKTSQEVVAILNNEVR